MLYISKDTVALENWKRGDCEKQVFLKASLWRGGRRISRGRKNGVGRWDGRVVDIEEGKWKAM